MRNILLLLSYDGRGFSGFQVQKNCPTVQGVLEEAIFSLTGERVRVTPSGRTDAGVHALCQVVNFQTSKRITTGNLLRGLNRQLPGSVRVREAKEIDPSFHAMKDAIRKHYCYLIYNGPVFPPFYRGYAWHIPHPRLDIDLMAGASRPLVGEHDFRSFMGSGSSVRNTVRVLESVDMKRGKSFLWISFRGRGFLRNMVRNITGTLVDVALGKMDRVRLDAVLADRDRRKAGRCAPGDGLYLCGVEYLHGTYEGEIPFLLD